MDVLPNRFTIMLIPLGISGEFNKYVKERSRSVQQLLFKAGYRWLGGSQEILHTDAPLLTISDKQITYSRNNTMGGLIECGEAANIIISYEDAMMLLARETHQPSTEADKFLSYRANTLEAAAKLMEKKRQDYAGADRYHNFKQVAVMTKQPIQTVLLTFVAVKVARLSELIKNGSEPNFESINDTIQDLLNYTLLFGFAAENKIEG